MDGLGSVLFGNARNGSIGTVVLGLALLVRPWNGKAVSGRCVSECYCGLGPLWQSRMGLDCCGSALLGTAVKDRLGVHCSGRERQGSRGVAREVG